MSDQKESFIEIPLSRLSEEIFNALIEEFILREGTDYGHDEVTLEQKKSRVIKQIRSGEVKIVFSTLTENTSLMTRSQLKKLDLS